MAIQESYDPNCCACRGTCMHVGPHSYCGKHMPTSEWKSRDIVFVESYKTPCLACFAKDADLAAARKRIEELEKTAEEYSNMAAKAQNACEKYRLQIVELEATVATMREALERISGMAGNPDAAQGCRNIIAVARAALDSGRKGEK